jgi:hypothetical protein
MRGLIPHGNTFTSPGATDLVEIIMVSPDSASIQLQAPSIRTEIQSF